MNILILIGSLFLTYAIDIIVFGITYHALANRFGWRFSNQITFFIFFVIFTLYDCYLWPAAFISDATFTIHNEELSRFFEIKPDQPFIELFDIGLFELVEWSLKATIADYLGKRVIFFAPQQERNTIRRCI